MAILCSCVGFVVVLSSACIDLVFALARPLARRSWNWRIWRDWSDAFGFHVALVFHIIKCGQQMEQDCDQTVGWISESVPFGVNVLYETMSLLGWQDAIKEEAIEMMQNKQVEPK